MAPAKTKKVHLKVPQAPEAKHKRSRKTAVSNKDLLLNADRDQPRTIPDINELNGSRGLDRRAVEQTTVHVDIVEANMMDGSREAMTGLEQELAEARGESRRHAIGTQTDSAPQSRCRRKGPKTYNYGERLRKWPLLGRIRVRSRSLFQDRQELLARTSVFKKRWA